MDTARLKRRMAGKAILKLDRIVNFSAAKRQLFSSGNSARRLPCGYNAEVAGGDYRCSGRMRAVLRRRALRFTIPAGKVVLPFAVVATDLGAWRTLPFQVNVRNLNFLG